MADKKKMLFDFGLGSLHNLVSGKTDKEFGRGLRGACGGTRKYNGRGKEYNYKG